MNFCNTAAEKKVKKFYAGWWGETTLKNPSSKALFYSNLSIHKQSTRYPQSFKMGKFLRFDFKIGSISFVHLTKEPVSIGFFKQQEFY